MKVLICCISFLFSVNLKSTAQTKIDSAVQNYLLENKEIDTILYKVKKEGNSVSVESNYFNNKILDINGGNCSVKGYRFGSNSVHRTSFVLLDFFKNNIHSYVFFGKDGFENDLARLLLILRADKSKLKIANKKEMVDAVMSIYH